MIEFTLPDSLNRLLATGVWPSAAGPAITERDFKRIIPADRVRRFAPEETLICLLPPPFFTMTIVRGDGGASSDWWVRDGALDQIDPELALVIGDFRLGSDSPIILDYARDPLNPPVLYPRWGTRSNIPGWVPSLISPVLRLLLGTTNIITEWVQGARDFDDFAEMLGVAEDVR
jgi:hypothetical protein